MIAPEAILRGALRVLHVAAFMTRDWTLSDKVSRKQINDLWEAIHEIPDLLKRWNPAAEKELLLYLREYNTKWKAPDLMAIYEDGRREDETGRPVMSSPPRRDEGIGIRFTGKQGQYLAFINNYVRIHGRAPAEADMKRFFKTTPPTIHQMILTLEAKKLVRRVPGQARSIELLVKPDELPVLR